MFLSHQMKSRKKWNNKRRKAASHSMQWRMCLLRHQCEAFSAWNVCTQTSNKTQTQRLRVQCAAAWMWNISCTCTVVACVPRPRMNKVLFFLSLKSTQFSKWILWTCAGELVFFGYFSINIFVFDSVLLKKRKEIYGISSILLHQSDWSLLPLSEAVISFNILKAKLSSSK